MDIRSNLVKRTGLVLSLLVLLALSALPLAAQERPIQIEMVHIFGSEQDSRVEVIQAAADAFMAVNPDVQVTLSSPSTDYTELFNGALLAAGQGNAPEIVLVEEGLTQLAYDSQLFLAIEDLASDEQRATLEDVLPSLLNFYRIDGKLWSMPWNASNPILYYNRGMFEAAGLDPDAPPTTFDEILTACAAIMALPDDTRPTAGCISWPMSTWFPEQWVAMQNGLFVNNDNGRSARATEALFTSSEMTRVVDWFAELSANGYYTYSGTPNDFNGEGQAFLGGSSAMTLNSTAGISLFQRFSGVFGVDLGIAALPTPGADATNGGTIGGGSLWITAGHSDEETQAAVNFIFFLTNTAQDIAWHQGSGYFPVRQSSIDQLTVDGWFEENPAFGIALEQLQTQAGNVANAGAVIGPAPEVRGALIAALQSIVDQGEDPMAALEAAKAQADAALVDYNAAVGG
jgi:sn-glycerol 3-phosphate transport system substrate-binding protein